MRVVRTAVVRRVSFEGVQSSTKRQPNTRRSLRKCTPSYWQMAVRKAHRFCTSIEHRCYALLRSLLPMSSSNHFHCQQQMMTKTIMMDNVFHFSMVHFYNYSPFYCQFQYNNLRPCWFFFFFSFQFQRLFVKRRMKKNEDENLLVLDQYMHHKSSMVYKFSQQSKIETETK